MIPADGAEIVLVDVVEAHGAKSASGRRSADAAARHDVRIAQEGLSVRRECCCVLHELARHVVALVQLVDLVCAVAGRFGAGADEDLSSSCQHPGVTVQMVV